MPIKKKVPKKASMPSASGTLKLISGHSGKVKAGTETPIMMKETILGYQGR